jgi:NADH:ubiquinone oxidoreductase subunit 6 (subunit J)
MLYFDIIILLAVWLFMCIAYIAKRKPLYYTGAIIVAIIYGVVHFSVDFRKVTIRRAADYEMLVFYGLGACIFIWILVLNWRPKCKQNPPQEVNLAGQPKHGEDQRAKE